MQSSQQSNIIAEPEDISNIQTLLLIKVLDLRQKIYDEYLATYNKISKTKLDSFWLKTFEEIFKKLNKAATSNSLTKEYHDATNKLYSPRKPDLIPTQPEPMLVSKVYTSISNYLTVPTSYLPTFNFFTREVDLPKIDSDSEKQENIENGILTRVSSIPSELFNTVSNITYETINLSDSQYEKLSENIQSYFSEVEDEAEKQKNNLLLSFSLTHYKVNELKLLLENVPGSYDELEEKIEAELTYFSEEKDKYTTQISSLLRNLQKICSHSNIAQELIKFLSVEIQADDLKKFEQNAIQENFAPIKRQLITLLNEKVKSYRENMDKLNNADYFKWQNVLARLKDKWETQPLLRHIEKTSLSDKLQTEIKTSVEKVNELCLYYSKFEAPGDNNNKKLLEKIQKHCELALQSIELLNIKITNELELYSNQLNKSFANELKEEVTYYKDEISRGFTTLFNGFRSYSSNTSTPTSPSQDPKSPTNNFSPSD